MLRTPGYPYKYHIYRSGPRSQFTIMNPSNATIIIRGKGLMIIEDRKFN